MNQPLVHAIIGCGRIAPAHVDAFRRISDLRLKYACAMSLQNASAFAASQGIEQASDSIAEVINDPEVTSLSIAVPHFLHAPMAIMALQAGKHVLVEKPAGMNGREVGQIHAATTRASNLIALPVTQHRFDPLVREVANLVLTGALGTIALCRAHLECFRPVDYYTNSSWRGTWSREGGSVLINQAYHIMDLILWLTGPIQSVSAEMQTRIYQKAIETEDTLTAQFRFASNALGSLTVCGAAGSMWNSYLEIVGSSGYVAFDIGYPNRLHRLHLEDKATLLATRKRLKEIGSRQEPLPIGPAYYGTSHRGQAAAFAEMIRSGQRETYTADLQQAGQVVRVIDAIYAAARERRQIGIPAYENA